MTEKEVAGGFRIGGSGWSGTTMWQAPQILSDNLLPASTSPSDAEAAAPQERMMTTGAMPTKKLEFILRIPFPRTAATTRPSFPASARDALIGVNARIAQYRKCLNFRTNPPQQRDSAKRWRHIVDARQCRRSRLEEDPRRALQRGMK